MMKTAQQLMTVLDELTLSAWTLAAFATVFESGLAEALAEPKTLDELARRVDSLPRERIERCLDVVAGRGLVTVTDGKYQLAEGAMCFAKPPMRTFVQAELRTSMLQPAAYVDAAARGTPTRGWHHTDPRILQAQGDASAQFAGALKNHLLPMFGDLGERLARPSARLLDVGVGVASLSIAMCRNFPELRVVGLDVFDVPLGMARENVARAGLADRIELRQLALEDLKEEAAYDLVWLPACFLTPSGIPVAMTRARAALRPGGRILLPAISDQAPDAHRRVYSLVLEQWGAVTPASFLVEQLAAAGFVQPQTLPGPSPWMALVTAQP
jgi:2-polyprenyl-3-methyl-5-hydroxy-6-metoxy-1,4-benzoquinol methylase